MDTVNEILIWLSAHPSLQRAAIIYGFWFLFASAVINGIRTAYPSSPDRPRLVAFLLGLLDLTVLNVWFLLRKWVPGIQGPITDVYVVTQKPAEGTGGGVEVSVTHKPAVATPDAVPAVPIKVGGTD